MKRNLWLLALILVVCLIGVVGQMLFDETSKPLDTVTGLKVDTAIRFTEICAKNQTILADNDGKHRDYIELHNSGSAVSLKGYTLYDGKNKSAPFDDIVLEENEYRVFFVSRSETGFAIGASGGDTIQLLDPAGRIVAQVSTTMMQEDEVMLWKNGAYKNSFEASPGFSNDSNGVKAFREGISVNFDRLVINEVLIENASALPDEKGIYSDIVELHNISESDIELSHFFVSDNLNDRFCYRLPEMTLESGSYLLLYCDGGNYISPEGYIHTNFRLSHGEEIVLTAHTGEYMTVPVSYIGEDISLSLGDDGAYSATDPSLGFPNDAYGMEMLRESRINWDSALVISEVLLSSSGVPYMGEFRDVIEITNMSDEQVNTIGWYLSDGNDPYDYPLTEKTLNPGESVVIICGSETTGFSLSEGETLLLTGTDYLHAPPVFCTNGDLGKSISLVSAGEESSYVFQDVTMGYPNDSSFHRSFLQGQTNADLQISEIMSNNISYLQGAYQTTSDWIELYNASDKDIRLSEYCLTDRSGNLGKYQLPDKVLSPGQYIVILLKDDATNLPKGYDVLPGSLSSDGETLYLSKNGSVVDYVFLPSLTTDMSYGREKDSIFFALLQSVTPGSANSVGVEMSSVPLVLTTPGVYNDVDYVDVILSAEGEIYYTTSCYAPSENSLLYTGPIRLTETTVLRVVCREEGKLTSEILDLTYIINEDDTLPVVSMVTSPDNLWNIDTGIYVMGNYAEEKDPYKGANFWMPWEKPASLTLFETDGSGFSVNCGIRIFGGFSRALEKKSFSLLFRDTYGDGELCYPIFGEEGLDTFEALILRTSGQDAFSAKMRDVVITSLMSEYTDVPVQAYKPVVLYLNGEYWGLYYFREKLNEHYIAGHYNIDSDDVNMVKLAGWSCEEYIELLRYTVSHDMTVQEYYDYVCSRIDVDNYIDFYIAEMWIGNSDNGNVRYFLNEEGKWTWILYDTDITFQDSDMNFVASNLNEDGIGPGDTTCKTFAVKLMENQEFREKFLLRLAWQMNTIWTEDNIIRRIDQVEAMIIADMPKETARWGDTFENWEADVEHLRQYARERNGFMLEHIQNYFGLSDKEMRDYGFNV